MFLAVIRSILGLIGRWWIFFQAKELSGNLGKLTYVKEFCHDNLIFPKLFCLALLTTFFQVQNIFFSLASFCIHFDHTFHEMPHSQHCYDVISIIIFINCLIVNTFSCDRMHLTISLP